VQEVPGAIETVAGVFDRYGMAAHPAELLEHAASDAPVSKLERRGEPGQSGSQNRDGHVLGHG
jgi:hypothetical protein